MVRLELTASASQMRRSSNWTTSRFGSWVIYPLTSHSSWRTLPLAVSHRPCQVLPPDIMYCTIASPPCQYIFQKFLKYFLHTTYQKMQADLISKFYLSNYTRFNLYCYGNSLYLLVFPSRQTQCSCTSSYPMKPSCHRLIANQVMAHPLASLPTHQ